MSRRFLVIGNSLPNLPPLTNREEDVVALVAEGLPNKDIGQRLKISTETVKEHVQNILKKWECRGRAHAAVLAYRRGILGGLQVEDSMRPTNLTSGKTSFMEQIIAHHKDKVVEWNNKAKSGDYLPLRGLVVVCVNE